MTADQRTLVEMLVANDAGFGLYKTYHWERVVRDEVEPWLTDHGYIVVPEELREALRAWQDRPDRVATRTATSQTSTQKVTEYHPDYLDALLALTRLVIGEDPHEPGN